jgi:adenylosuccinate synthase
MAVDVLIGLQWGDEGKGKIVDCIAHNYAMIARFQGGPNAGHTLVFDNQKIVLHTLPSGILKSGIINLIGGGVVIDPIILKKEIELIKKINPDVQKQLLISKRAHLIIPTHKILDAASEAQKGESKIGSTLKGIGPTYMDKTGRNGLRIGDILEKNFKNKYTQLKEKHFQLLKLYNGNNTLENEAEWFEAIEYIKQFSIVDAEYIVNDLLNNGESILAEGAQGSMLDVDFGTYPFVTSSTTITAGACKGIGFAPQKIREVIGITKAYCTRVGSGAFPTELHDEDGEKLRNIGNEFGSTTGRPRRCGWIDIPALKYAIMLNGVTQIALTKTDVLNDFNALKMATHYQYNGIQTDKIPFDLQENSIEPLYKIHKGWNNDICDIKDFNALPHNCKSYIHDIERLLHTRISMISTGADRNQLIIK